MKLTSALTRGEMRLVLAACAAACGVATMSTAFNFILAPIQDTFDASDQQMTILREAPSIAALLMVFPAGVLGPRIGEKRFILLCSALFSLGTFLAAVSPVVEVASLGFLIANVGRTGMFIVGLAFMARSITTQDGRAAAFSFFYMVLPVVSIVMPVLAGVLVNGPGWRWVALLCSAFGLASIAVVQFLIPPVPPSASAGEMWTPAIAGLVLAFAVRALNGVSHGFLSAPFLVPAVLCCITLAVLLVLLRRLSHPSLSVAPLRHGAFMIFLAVLLLFGFANLWFYTTLAFQFIFGLSVLGAAIAMIPAQVAALGGAALAGRLTQRAGIARAGFALIVGVAVFLWVAMVVSADSPLWLPILIVSLYAMFAVGAGVPITTAIMGSAPKGDEGDASAYRGAATNLGNAVSVAIMTFIVATAVTGSLQSQEAGSGIDISASQGSAVVEALNAGESTDDVASQYGLTTTQVEQVDAMEVQAYVVGYRVQGLVGGFVTVSVGVAFYLVARRREQGSSAAADA